MYSKTTAANHSNKTANYSKLLHFQQCTTTPRNRSGVHVWQAIVARIKDQNALVFVREFWTSISWGWCFTSAMSQVENQRNPVTLHVCTYYICMYAYVLHIYAYNYNMFFYIFVRRCRKVILDVIPPCSMAPWFHKIRVQTNKAG